MLLTVKKTSILKFASFCLSAEEEDDAPLIRGFSDDEPLVIA